MGPQSLSRATVSAARKARLLAALPLLREAREDAADAGLTAWEFALTVRELLAAGLTGTDLRWLVAGGYALHAEEEVRPRLGPRTFHDSPDLAVTAGSCYVLTDCGASLLAAWKSGGAADSFRQGQHASEVPSWDQDRRELVWLGRVVKRYRQPAANQQAILDAFQEESWPHRIDDPLPPLAEIAPSERLREAIRALNRHQSLRLLRFRGDGTGCGVIWEGVEVPLL